MSSRTRNIWRLSSLITGSSLISAYWPLHHRLLPLSRVFGRPTTTSSPIRAALSSFSSRPFFASSLGLLDATTTTTTTTATMGVVSSASEEEEDPNPTTTETKSEGKEENDNDVDQLVKELGKVVVTDDSEEEASKALKTCASWIKEGSVRKIIVVTGAGISVSAGIPDFRTPGTGLYDNLQKYNLPYPEAVFDLEFFAENPQPFVTLAKELWPTGLTFRPTITHCFLTLLARKELLLRVYSQNIDGLEHLAELPTEKLVECHGHFRSASCIRCKTAAPDMELIQDTIIQKAEAPVCHACKTGYIKPDIVFFGEGLPNRFHNLLSRDVKDADCCLVLGTSLMVAPVSNIPEMVNKKKCRRILINREQVGSFPSRRFASRDEMEIADCDTSVRKLAKLLGWLDELEELHAKVSKKFSKEG